MNFLFGQNPDVFFSGSINTDGHIANSTTIGKLTNIKNRKAKYSILDENTYDFNKTRLIMDIILTRVVIIDLDY